MILLSCIWKALLTVVRHVNKLQHLSEQLGSFWCRITEVLCSCQPSRARHGKRWISLVWWFMVNYLFVTESWQLRNFWKMCCHPSVLLSILIPSEMRKLLSGFGLMEKKLCVLQHLSTAHVTVRRITYLEMSAKISLWASDTFLAKAQW